MLFLSGLTARRSSCLLREGFHGQLVMMQLGRLGTSLLYVAVAVAENKQGSPEQLLGCGGCIDDYVRPSERPEFNSRCSWLLKTMGATAYSGGFSWQTVEAQRGKLDWSDADAEATMAQQMNWTLFSLTGFTPDWALEPAVLAKYGPGIGFRFPPDESFATEFEQFFEAAAKRYCGARRNYMFWNEQNGCSWMNSGCMNGNMSSSYAPWLKRWYTAMKRGCSDTVLSVGALDYNNNAQCAQTATFSAAGPPVQR